MNTCITCKYWLPTERHLDALGRASNKGGNAESVGECHFLPPQPSQAAGGAWRIFASTRASDWCGQFATAPKPPPELAKKPVDSTAAKA